MLTIPEFKIARHPDIMYLDMIRLIYHRDNSLGALYIDGKWECWTLEDEHREQKVHKETRIDDGIYQLKLRTEGGMSERYAAYYTKKFGPDWHKGMLWLTGTPRHLWIYLHVGNTDDDTEGCPLVGAGIQVNGEQSRILASRVAYEQLYPKVAGHLAGGLNAYIRVWDLERGLISEHNS